ncbi:MAG: hypothetical protein BWX79_03194 [Alphaproteobacteria bacterium ADurb.Bin100]|nr:MAG: hypothetical protein BWX79_03194 [Alphaproteobacteria bacterium ADurb.Bin100]
MSRVSSFPMPCSRQKRRTSTAPNSEWSPPRPFAMSWNRAATYSTHGLSQPAASCEQKGYSCACSAMKKRRMLRNTIRMCWSTV